MLQPFVEDCSRFSVNRMVVMTGPCRDFACQRRQCPSLVFELDITLVERLSPSDGLRVGPLVLRARPADLNAIAAGGFSIVIAAAGAAGPRLAQAAHMARALCVTRDIEAVRAGTCTMAITTEPRVEITVNHAAAAAAGIDFAAAFRMMIKEI